MKHLKEQNKNYFEHLTFSWKTSSQLLVLVVVGVIHGIFPFVFSEWVSSEVHRINNKLDI
jgi:hypothetical protein